MEFFDPYNVKDVIEMVAGFMTCLLALGGLYYASQTFIIAKEAKDEWKRQKQFEIDTEGYAMTLDALKVLEDLRLDQYDATLVKSHSSEILDDIFNYGEEEVYRSYVQLYSYSKYCQDLKPRIFEIRKKALILFNQSDDEDLIDFYDHFMSFEAAIISIHHNYHTSIINRFVDVYDYKLITKEIPAVNLYFNAIKKETGAEDFEIYQLLYKKFFTLEEGDWLEPLRAKHISFFYRNFKRKGTGKRVKM